MEWNNLANPQEAEDRVVALGHSNHHSKVPLPHTQVCAFAGLISKLLKHWARGDHKIPTIQGAGGPPHDVHPYPIAVAYSLEKALVHKVTYKAQARGRRET